MSECGICLQDYDDETVPAALPCGHLSCIECLTTQATSNPFCPTCRKPFTQQQITRLFLTFPAAPEAAPPSEQDKNEDPVALGPPPLTEQQKSEALDLSTKMSNLGVVVDVDSLARVLDDVKLWTAGVSNIADLETQVAVTRLLLSVDILRNKAEQSITTSSGKLQAEKALAASHRVEARLRDQLNRESAKLARTRTERSEQAALVEQWKQLSITKQDRIQELEMEKIDHLGSILELTNRVRDETLTVKQLDEELDAKDE
ncbi:hypothetical protein DL93DRAFT_641252 [Clavulina sp. PMI_390]|nr:hypothetical protein DL93DRAFT_641252 [Clavulina sp. PMI_390]